MQVAENLRKYEYIIAFPYGANLDATPDGLTARLSILSEIVVTAAVAAQELSPRAKIIFPGEHTFGEEFDCTTDLAAAHAYSLNPDLIDSDLFQGLYALPGNRKLDNTYLQAQAVADYFDLIGGGGSVLTIPLNYHKSRVEEAMNPRVPTDIISAEDILRHSNITDYDKYFPILSEFGSSSEAAIRLLAKFGGKGRIPNLFTLLFGPRVADIYNDGQGNLTPYLSTGRRRLRELQRAEHTQTAQTSLGSAG